MAAFVAHRQLVICAQRKPVLCAQQKPASRASRRRVPRGIRISKAATELIVQLDETLKNMDTVALTLTSLMFGWFTASFSPVNPLYWMVLLRVIWLSARQVWGRYVLRSPLEPAAKTLTTFWVTLTARVLNAAARVVARVQDEKKKPSSE